MPHEEIKVSDNIRLIQLQPEQAGRLFELTDSNREYLGEFLPWVPYVRSSHDSLKHIQETLDNRANGKAYTYGIEVDGEIVGDISLRNLGSDKTTEQAEIGYWLAKDYAGKGITTLATRALTDYGINKLGLEKVIIRVAPDNVASNKVAEKAGYIFIGQIDDEKYKKLNVWTSG